MKNEILDDIFNDKLHDQLEEGEVVVWEGQPQFNSYPSIIMSLAYGINLWFAILNRNYWLISFWVILPIVSFIPVFFRQKKTRYLITNQRIIFQLPRNYLKTKIQSLPLNQLAEVIVKDKVSHNGTLELVLKKTFQTKIKTNNIRNGFRRKNPTLEFVDDVITVRNHIEHSINRIAYSNK